jgi:hypothetical protein
LEERDGGHILTQIGYNQIYTAWLFSYFIQVKPH